MSLLENMADLVQRWTPHRAKLLEAIERTNGTHTEDDVLAMILGGSLYLMTTEKSACVYEVIRYPRFNCLNAFLAAGELQDMDIAMRDLENRARELGCKRVTWGGREGWKAVCKGEGEGIAGFKSGGVFLYKDLSP